MSAAKNVRWVCPDCAHYVAAPRRLRKIDVRRYCLKCSEFRGTLVERSAPVLDRQREEAAAKRAERAKRDRARAAALRREKTARTEERYNLPGFDLRVEAKALWKIFRKQHSGLSEFCPRVELKRTNHGGGRAFPSAHVIEVSPSNDRAWAFVLLVHELAHCVVRRQHDGIHGRAFYQAMKEVIQERLGIPISFYGVRGQTRGYKVDHVIERQVRDFVKAVGA